MKTLIICASKYGSTFEIGRWLAERLGDDCLVDKAESMPDPADADIVILGSGIYNHHVLPSVQKYVNRFRYVNFLTIFDKDFLDRRVRCRVEPST